MKEDELQKIRARVEAATEGPWEYIGFGVIGNVECEVVECRGKTAEFIAEARQDVPKLLAEVERLRKELTSIVTCIDEYYANEEDDIPVHDLLGCIRDDAIMAVNGND